MKLASQSPATTGEIQIDDLTVGSAKMYTTVYVRHKYFSLQSNAATVGQKMVRNRESWITEVPLCLEGSLSSLKCKTE